MSIEKDLAKEKVQQHIEKTYNAINSERELVIVDMIPYDDEGWTVFFDTKKSIETDDWRYGLTGNHPIFIFKDSGKMYSVYPETDEAEIVKKYRKENPLPAIASHSHQRHAA
jgi:Immunity protein 35